MAERETIKEFLAKLGFEVNSAQWQKFSHTLRDAAKLGERLGEVLVATATAMAVSSDRMARDMQKLNFESGRAKSTVSNLQSIAYAAERIGLSGEGIQSTVEAMRMLMRQQPGLAGLLKNYGIDPNEDTTKVLTQLVGRLRKMPFYIGSQIGQMFGIDPKTLLQLEQHYKRFLADQKQGLLIQKEMGVDTNAAAVAGNKYAQSLTEIGQRVYVLREGLMVALMPAMKAVTGVINDLLKRFMQWVGANKKIINQRVIEYVNGLSSALQKIPWHAIVAGVKRFGSGLNWLAKHAGGWSNLITGFLVLFTANATGLTTAISGLTTALVVMFATLTPARLGILAAVAAAVGGVEAYKFYKKKGKGDALSGFKQELDAVRKQFAAAGGDEQAVTGAGARLPLGLRHNNPGNLMPGGKEATYTTMQAGLVAMGKLLLKYSAHGTNTIRKIISKYAPASAGNPTGNYIRNVSAALGIDPDKALGLAHHPEMLARLQGTMIQFEQHRMPFSSSQLLGAAHAAGSVTNNNVTSTAHISVDGSRSPAETARAVEQRLNRVNADIIHNTRSPVY